MPLIAGKQLKDAPDGVDTAKINDGALSADAAGRLKMADDYFNNTTTVGAKFSDASVPLAKLEEAVLQADGGQVFTGDQDADGNKIVNLGAPTDPNDAARLQDVVTSKTWKELLLCSEQLLNGASGGVLQAILLNVAINPSDGDTFILYDGTTTETFTFKNSPSVAFDVQIGASAAATQTNLVSQINTDSTLWSAVEKDYLDEYFAGTPANQAIVYRTATNTNPDRVYGSLTAAAGIKVVEFDNSAGGYTSSDGTEVNLPSSDPATKTFGIGRLKADLVTNETHTIADNGQFTWDEDDDAWRQVDTGAIEYGTTGDITDVNAGDTAGAGSSTKVARADHEHGVATGASTAQIDVGDAAAEGTSTNLAREDHQHALPAPGAPADVTKAAASAGSATTVARADHKHDVSTGTPGGLGTANAEGTATSLARSDHVHVRDSWTEEEITTQLITNTDTALTDTLNNTPITARGINLYLNGVRQQAGAGNDYTLSGTTITWLAGTGSAVNMKTNDELIAAYWY